ncbi:hypothetical protein LO772_22485 [Yinghuangia sp. ASG 101]|uniref:hypothetical protein n=1 Tax=Yinghuangia sp. ASG 101 TaxID=2896848 RepID=UPI001E50DAAC|nr:hypothetical protein [Yinghuangia sp. ASG 101]UGQ09673.1 hypothetical protein LO772_22485 [Yinghuangia sp. ASG 101]
MNRLLRQLLALALVFAVAVGFAPTASAAADDSPIGEEDGCVYVPEDWNGYEFTYYCPPGSEHELQHYFNSHARYYVNWSQDSPNAIGYKLKANQRTAEWNQDCTDAQVRAKLCNAAGQPCPRGTDGRTNCLNDHDLTGIGEWMRGQDNPGILTQDMEDLHLLENIRDNPCDVLQSPESGGHTGQWRLQDNCFDIRTTNPCSKISDRGQQDQCNAGHPWFEWEPPTPIDPANEPGCKYTEGRKTGECTGTQLVGGDKVQAPLGVTEPLADVAGVIILVVFIAGAFGVIGHLYYGVVSYRNGDTVGEVFGRMMWTLLACAGATSVSIMVWTVFNA